MINDNFTTRFGKLISKAEIYAFKFGFFKNISKDDLCFSKAFDKYGNLLNKSTKTNLFDALINEVELLNVELKEFRSKNKIFKIDNISKQQLIEHISKLISCVKGEEECIIYNNIITTIEKKYGIYKK